jgi:crotonobetainyl-CoA:carnitine CoA-transferase CaiB-like acyl-CoA transferase
VTDLPLTGIRIIEPGQLIAAPFASMLMADFGAEVIKTELPGIGEPGRRLGPFAPDGQSVWFKTVSRNKKSVTLDLRKADGARLFKALVGKADMVLENFRPGVMDRWGLGWEELRKVNPRLIMVRQSGFGQTGPYSSRPAYGMMVDAYGGFAANNRYSDTPPLDTGLGDYVAGLSIAYAAMFALYHRDVHGGPGQLIDNAAMENIIRISGDPTATALRLGVRRTAGRGPSEFPRWPEGSLTGTGPFRTKDGRFVTVHPGTSGTSIWKNFMHGMGRPDFLDETSFPARSPERVARGREIEQAVEDFFATRTQAEIVAFADAHDVTIAPIKWIDDLFDDPQVQARGMFIEVPDEDLGPLTMVRPTPVFSETPGQVSHAGPRLGEHNDEIYSGLLGLSDAELAALRRDAVI